MNHHAASHRSPEMSDCIDRCTECHSICLETLRYCLGEGGKHAAPDHIALLASCADICATSANVMLLGAEVHRHTCGACADICRTCAEQCAAMDDAEMSRCAEACRRCAESCAAMAAA